MKFSAKLWLVLASLSGVTAEACTTFATFNGANDSLLMAKNRDNHPDRQIIEVVSQPGKLKYLALSRQDVPDFVSAGVNEKNLAVFNEVTIEYANQAKGGIADDFSKDILQNYSKAIDVIKDLPKLVAKFPDPVFYQVADSDNLVAIEVAPHQQVRYQVYHRGQFAHTNNYQQASLIQNYPYTPNERNSLLNSQARSQRALELVKQASAPTLATMQKIALDHPVGAENSILRSGDPSKPNSVRSLAFFGTQLPRTSDQAATVVANLYNVNETYELKLDSQFWQQYPQGYTILTAHGAKKS